MASIYDLKPAFQRLLRPMNQRIVDCGITANMVTVIAVLMSVAMGLIIFIFPIKPVLVTLPLFLFFRMALNAIDGMIAREHNMKSNLGAVLNEIGDVISDIALYLPLACISGMPSALIAIIVVLSVICEMAGVVAIEIGGKRRYEGPMGKSDRAFCFGILGLLLGCGLNPGLWTIIFFTVILLLLVYTIYNRCRKALQEVA